MRRIPIPPTRSAVPPREATGLSAGHVFPFAFAVVFVFCVEKRVVVDPLGVVGDLLNSVEGLSVCGGVLLRKAVGVLLDPVGELCLVEVVLVLDLQLVAFVLGVEPKDRRAPDALALVPVRFCPNTYIL